MRSITVLAVVALMLVAGCATGGTPGSDPGATPTPSGTPDGTDTPGVTPTPTPNSTPADDGTSVYEVKRALDDRFAIGINFGMPTVYNESTMREFVAEHERLAERIRADYGIEATPDLFAKVKQFTQMSVANGSDGVYDFTVRSGNSCVIRTIEGEYVADTGTITVHSDTNESVPC